MRSMRQSHRSVSSARRLPARDRLFTLMLATLSTTAQAAGPQDAGHVEFEPGFFLGSAETAADLSRFSRANAVLPGKYRVDILLNGESRQTQEVRFVEGDGETGVYPCLSDHLLRGLGLSAEVVGDVELTAKEPETCSPVDVRFPGVKANFDVASQSLDIIIPQGMLDRQPRGYVDPASWDYGVNAGLLGYRFNSYTNRTQGATATSNYLGLNAGLNLRKWRLRHASSLTSGSTGSAFKTINTYVQRDIPSLKSQLVVGDTYTDGRQIDSFRIRGLTLSSDERMTPSSLVGYAPTVQGVAETNARVVISQRGTQLYQATVAPGPFVIDDLYATGYGGDLLVEVHEADGRVRRFTVAYAATPNILREGQTRYALSVGQFNEERASDKPWLAQATYARGLTSSMTGYVGSSYADGYASLQLGSALNTRIGAVSLDVTGARATLSDQEKRSGHSLQVRYSKNFAKQGTTFALGAYRYSTEGYLSLADTMRVREAISAGFGTERLDRIRSRFDLTLNQSLGQRGGSFYLNSSAQSYWNARRDTRSFSLGYSNNVGPVTFGVSAQRSTIINFDNTSRDDTVYQLNLSMPLGKQVRAPVMVASVSQEDRRGGDARLGLNGSIGEDNLLRYGVAASSGQSRETQVSGNLEYMASAAQLSAGASTSSGYRTANVGASGGVVIHPKGVTFAQSLGDTIAVVEAQGAAGARVSNATGVRIDQNGFAVVPYLTPYAKNAVDLDPAGATLDVEFDATSQTVVPTLGSVLMLDYASKAGQATLIQAADHEGKPLPFGADVLNADGAVVGVVGQASRIFVNRADQEVGYLVRWSAAPADQCEISLPDAVVRRKGEQYTRLTLSCTPVITAGSPESVAASK